MRVMAGGNVTVNHHAAPVAKPATTSPPKPGMRTFAKLAAVGLAASGVGIPAAIGVSMLPSIISALRPGVVAAPATQQPSGNLLNDYDLFVGEPE